MHNAVSQHEGGVLSTEFFREEMDQQTSALHGNALPGARAVSSVDKLSLLHNLRALKEMEELLVAEALKCAEGNQTIAAQLPGVSRKALNNCLNRSRIATLRAGKVLRLHHLQTSLQRGGTFRIFGPFCGASLNPLSGKSLSALYAKSCRISRPDVPPLSILQYRASSPPSKKILVPESAPRLNSTPSPTSNWHPLVFCGTVNAINISET